MVGFGFLLKTTYPVMNLELWAEVPLFGEPPLGHVQMPYTERNGMLFPSFRDTWGGRNWQQVQGCTAVFVRGRRGA